MEGLAVDAGGAPGAPFGYHPARTLAEGYKAYMTIGEERAFDVKGDTV